MSLLVLENIVKEYGNQPVLTGVSLRVEKGERVGLIGPNGAGKTTLLKIALGLESCDSGSVSVARNIKIGYLSQDLESGDPSSDHSQTILHYEKVYQLEQKLRELEKQLADSSTGHSSPRYERLMKDYSGLLARYESLDGYTIENKISRILLGLGLRRESLSSPLSKLSGGEKMRVAVARMLLEEPDLLVLDEPTNHLDIQATQWLEGFLKRFEGGIIFVSHDRYFLDRVATRIAELEKGSLCVRSGNYSSFLAYKRQLAQQLAKEQNRLQWAIKNTHETIQGLKTQRKIQAIKSREKHLRKLKAELHSSVETVRQQAHLHRSGSLKLEFKKIKHRSKDIAWAENLRKSFGSVVLFSGASFQIRGGERVGIIGPNGSGKTTLIRMLLGQDTDYEGFLRLGEWVNYSYMGQEILFADEEQTMLELIMAKSNLLEGEARNFLARFQFYGDEVDKAIRVLSGGEKVRLYLACVVLEDADCLILDEPTNHLDVPARDAVEAALREFKGTIIAITHDRFFLTNCVNKILEIEKGLINTYLGNYDLYRQLKFGPGEESPVLPEARPVKVPVAVKEKKKNKTKEIDPEKERQELEGEIIMLELEAKALEASFTKNTPPEKYHEYDNLQKKIAQLYQRWEELV